VKSAYAYNANPVIYGDPDGNVVKILVTVVKVAIKGGDIYSTVSGIVDNAKVIMDPNASAAEKAMAAADIALDIGTGINTRDIKAAAKAVDKAADRIQAMRQTEKAADKAEDASSKVRNPYGSKGKPDHQAKVDELAKKAEGELQPGEKVVRERKIQGHEDSNRRPDVQIVDEHGKARKIFEAERKPGSARNKAREAEYDRLKIPHETHGL